MLWLMLATTCFAQTSGQTENLVKLGKVWGFLKYYHSSALKGIPDWDKELNHMVKAAEETAAGPAFDALLEKWYRSLPAPKLADKAVNRKADSFDLIFSEKDIRKMPVTAVLKKEFVKLYRYHIPDTSRYVTRFYRNHRFDHIIHTEDAHERPAYPALSMRMLALYRYWNTIEYFYPHKKTISDWNAVLAKYIPQFWQAKDSIEYRLAIRKLIHELPDSHSFMQQPGEAALFSPFRIDYIDGKYIIGQCDSVIAATHDYKRGDEIMAVNGKTVADIENELRKRITGTNTLSLHRNIAQELLKGDDSLVNVRFKRDGNVIEKKVELHTWPVHSKLRRSPSRPLWWQVEKGVWYVRFCRISNADTLSKLFSDISAAKTVIWDMRDYPNYNVVIRAYAHFFENKTILTNERNASDVYPGAFIKTTYDFTPDTSATPTIFKGKLIVLVNEYTQSLSESVASALRLRAGTVVMGRQTAGTTGNITWISLPGDIAVSYTGVGTTGLRGSFRQGLGVKIDIPVELTAEYVKNYEDYILYQAIERAKENG